MSCIIKCIVRGNQACVKNADLRHPSWTVVMWKRKSASPVRNVLMCILNHVQFNLIFYICIGSKNFCNILMDLYNHLPEDMLEIYDVYSTFTFTCVHLLLLIYLIAQCAVTDYLKKADMLQFSSVTSMFPNTDTWDKILACSVLLRGCGYCPNVLYIELKWLGIWLAT
jgi:hypothetical protein